MKRIYLKKWVLLLLLMSGCCFATANQFYDLTNIPSGDTLTLRSGPGTEHKKLLELASDTQFITADNTKKPTQQWAPIIVSGTHGWVNKHYLSQSKFANFNELKCTGTEPFWSLSLNDNIFSYNDTLDTEQDKRFALSSVNPSINHTNRWFLIGQSANETLKISLHKSKSCTDDMSDKIYNYDLMVIDSKDKVVVGCCQ